MRKIYSISFIIIFLSIQNAFSQMEFVKSTNIRMESHFYKTPMAMPNAQHKELYIVKEDPVFQNIFTVIVYDSLLNIKWIEKYNSEKGFTNIHHYFDNQSGFHVIAKKENKFSVLSIDLRTKKHTQIIFRSPLNIRIKDFKVLKEEVYLIGNYKNKTLAMKYVIGDNEARVLPTFYNREIEIKDVFEDFASKSIYFVVKNFRNCELSIRPYSSLVGMMDMWQFRRKNSYNLRQVAIANTGNASKLIVGTENKNCSENIQGLLSFVVDKKNQSSSKSYSFTDFYNYLNQYRERRKLRIIERIQKKEKENKSVTLTSHLQLNKELKNNGKTWIALAENYNKDYKQIQTGSARFETVFDGYNYRYSIICAFDENGKKLWDNIMKITQYKKMDLSPVVILGFQGDSVIAAYKNENKLMTKFIYQHKTIQPEFKQNISELIQDHENIFFNDTKFIQWYDNSFLLIGNLTQGRTMGEVDFNIYHLKYVYKEQSATSSKGK